MNITVNERSVLLGILHSQYQDSHNIIGNYVWSWSANVLPNPRSFGGVVASLVKKGLIKQSGWGVEACVALTSEGYLEASFSRMIESFKGDNALLAG